MADFSQEERMRLAKRGLAMKDGSYPVPDVAALRDAIQAIGRAKDPAATKRFLIHRARALMAKSEIPLSWH